MSDLHVKVTARMFAPAAPDEPCAQAESLGPWILPTPGVGVSEMRIALVMNGGVSLAVWMGGVTVELDRARSAIGTDVRSGAVIDPVSGRRIAPASSGVGGAERTGEAVYERLLLLMNRRLRVDTVAGTSAGGINGALLGAAVACRRRIPDVRDLWIKLGRFEALLRGALEPDPPSLLKGDAYLLPNLEHVFADLLGSRESTSAPLDSTPAILFAEEAACPSTMSLMITGTDISGELVRHADDFGSEIDDTEHRAIFSFVRDPFSSDSTDTFAEPGAALRLARAARTSASFPVAFEPSFSRITGVGGEPAHGQPVDMSPVASFSSDRWLLDGGVLDNSPFRPVLDTFSGMPADTDVNRILAYVVPYISGPPDSASATMPTIKGVAGAVVNLPRDLGLTDDLIRIEEYRRRCNGRVGARRDLCQFPTDALLPLATSLFSIYREQRIPASINEILDTVDGVPPGSATYGLYVRRHDAKTPANLPWVPSDPVYQGAQQDWSWGLRSAERVARLSIQLIRDAMRANPTAGEDVITPLRTQRGILGNLLVQIVEVNRAFLERVAELDSDTPGSALAQAIEIFDPPKRKEALPDPGADEIDPSPAEPDGAEPDPNAGEDGDWADPTPREAARWLARRAAFALCRAFDGPARNKLAPKFVQSAFNDTKDLAEIDAAERRADVCLRHMLAVEVVERAIAGDYEPDQPFELIRVSPQASNSFDTRRAPKEKLAGAQLGHFGGFYKASWRANDWMWGRLDGADRLVGILLDPVRLRGLYAKAPGAAPAIAEYLVRVADDGLPHGHATELLAACGYENRAGAISALTAEVDAVLTDPASGLRRCRYLVRARLQYDILRDELPEIAQMIALDATDGSSGNGESSRWLQTYGKRLSERATLSPKDAIKAFQELRLNEELIGSEAGSDLLTRTVATALAVAGSALTSKKSGFPAPVRAVLHGLRGVLLAVYLLVRMFTQSSRFMRAVGVLVLAGAGIVVAYGLYHGADTGGGAAAGAGKAAASGGGGPPDLLVALGVAFVIAGVITGLIRGGWFGVLTAIALAVCAIMLVLSPWPGGGFTGIYHAFREHAATETLIVLFVAISAFSSFGGRWAWWPQRLYAATLRRLVTGPFAHGLAGDTPAQGAAVEVAPDSPFMKFCKSAKVSSQLIRWIRLAHLAALAAAGLAIYAASTGHDLDDDWLCAGYVAGAASAGALLAGLFAVGKPRLRRVLTLLHLLLAAIAAVLVLGVAISSAPLPHVMTHPPLYGDVLSPTEAYKAWAGTVVAVLVAYFVGARWIGPWLRSRIPELG